HILVIYGLPKSEGIANAENAKRPRWLGLRKIPAPPTRRVDVNPSSRVYAIPAGSVLKAHRVIRLPIQTHPYRQTRLRRLDPEKSQRAFDQEQENHEDYASEEKLLLFRQLDLWTLNSVDC